jgi:phosphoglycolate phosphatase-like HAD superfamily hydrolase
MGDIVNLDTLALDFDGILCDGLLEYFQTAWRAYQTLWPDAPAVPPATLEDQFQRLRPVVETGWEMPMVLRSLLTGQSEAAILNHWPELRTELLAQENLNPQSIGQQVDAIRDRWIDADLEGWLALHRFYPGITQQLEHWLQQQIPLFIITTKESRFVQALLERSGVVFPRAAIFGKDAQRSKSVTLQILQEKGFQNIWFVEDRLETLLNIQQVPALQTLQLFLGDWGYNTTRDRQRAQDHANIHLLSLDRFCQGFEHWLN